MSRCCILLLLLVTGSVARAADPPPKGGPPPDVDIALLTTSFDQAIQGDVTVRDSEVLTKAVSALTGSVAAPFGLPVLADLDAYDATGLVSFSETIELPGPLTVRPGDLVAVDGPGLFRLAVDASALGVPDGVNLDAAASVPGGIAVSFSETVQILGLTFRDEDLMVIDEFGCPFMALDADALGIDSGLDLDAAHFLPSSGDWLLSFDGAGQLPTPAAKGGPVIFRDTTILRYDPEGGSWSIFEDLGGLNRVAGNYDLDALSALGRDLFADGFESVPVKARGRAPKGCR